MKNISILGLTFLLFNCNQSKVETKTSDDKTIKEINQILYDNLVGVERGPFPEKNDSGYVDIQIEDYIDGLRKFKIFSEEFFKLERERLEPCRKSLIKLKYTGEPGPGDWENQVSCSFFHMYWLRSQESPTGYEIKNILTEGDIAKSEMVFYDEYEGNKSYRDGHIHLEIHYSKEQDDWRITQILRLPPD